MDNPSALLWIGFISILLLAGLLLLALRFVRKARPTPRLPYVAIPILTASERRFFSVLEGCIPRGSYVLAQVRLANLVAVESGTVAFRGRFNAIAMKCVDFVIVNHSTLAPLLIIELDDRSHELADRRNRDNFVDEVLSAAGLPILHWPVQVRYNLTELSRVIAARMQNLHVKA
jgi:very-short-patch-repair endonuclease